MFAESRITPLDAQPPQARRPGRIAAGFVVAITLLSAAASRASVVALWLFDDRPQVAEVTLADSGPLRIALTLGAAGRIVTGRFGSALAAIRPTADNTVAPVGPANSSFVARTSAHSRNPTDTALNLGGHDWTVECWLRSDESAQGEGTLFEIGCGRQGEADLCTRISVAPAESAFVIAGFAPGPATSLESKTVEFPDPSGPPSGTMHAVVSTLVLRARELPRGRWFHAALVHRAEGRLLQLYIDGVSVAVAHTTIVALPHGDDAYVVLAGDGRGNRRLMGAIDEMRISDAALYSGPFTPPASFAGAEQRKP